MKKTTKDLLSLVAGAVGLIGVIATVGFITDAHADSAAAPNMQTTDIKALADKMTFLDAKPALAGHPLLMEFWATWCPPCRASIAHLNKVNKKYHSKGLQIVGVSDEDKAVVKQFRTKTEMDYNVTLDGSQALAEQFQVRTIPQAFLFDASGHLVWSGHPMELDDSIIKKALAQQSKS